MLSLISVTAMALCFGVVFGGLLTVYKCPDGYPTQCIHPKESCPNLYLYSGPCLDSYYCCYRNTSNQIVCECKSSATFDLKLCDPTMKLVPCQECCFKCPDTHAVDGDI